ncbi:diguanylate cyclase domain-containing protein [Bacterioplanoides sp.]|uniref:diguanylate cyclase domain-containing protein n=1 Tax=Bacterioplanoides sp. TaxID=2066072 RepID=UPI003B004F5F
MSNNSSLLGSIAVTVFLSFPLLWLLQHSSNDSIMQDNYKFSALAQLRQQHSALSEAVLRARTGLDQNYDTLADNQRLARNHLQQLQQQLLQPEEDVQIALAALEVSHDKRLLAIEGFKSTQALLSNSLRYLPQLQHQIFHQQEHNVNQKQKELIAQINLDLINNRALSDIASMSRGKSQLSKLMKDRYADNESLTSFISHAQRLLQYQQQEAQFLYAILNNPIQKNLHNLDQLLRQKHNKKLSHAQNLKLFLMTYSAILALIMVVFIFNRYQLRTRLSEQKRISEVDQLTGLNNRRYFTAKLESLLSGNKTTHACLIFIDLDGFKQINDQLGHHHGDVVLREMANRLHQYCETAGYKNITLSRLGGDEFVMLIPELSSQASIQPLCDTILTLLSDPLPAPYEHFPLSGSFGVAFYPEHGMTVTDIMHAADLAMYQAKQQGKNNYQVFNAATSD